jgi:hypothetical protein
MEEQRIRCNLEHLRKYERTPLIKSVLLQEASFYDEVANFYDIDHSACKLRHESGKGPKETPDTLIDILSEFASETIDISKLGYADVREDYRRWNSVSERRKRTIVPMCAAVSLVGSIIGTIALYDESHNSEAILAGTSGSLVTALFVRWAMKSPKGTNNEIDEYSKLRCAAYNADHFMNEHYRSDFIKRHLTK